MDNVVISLGLGGLKWAGWTMKNHGMTQHEQKTCMEAEFDGGLRWRRSSIRFERIVKLRLQPCREDKLFTSKTRPPFFVDAAYAAVPQGRYQELMAFVLNHQS